jgi:maltose alpha-D-glucosyltransferase/alpha-amylase
MSETDSLWYKDAIIYQLHVKAFFDSNDDGIGDFRGLTQKLDYLQDLGVTALWLLPFYPSPMKDDGYDISDYYGIHPDYGTLGDFRKFLKAAHLKGFKVITELVINHTSDQHAWFQKARRAKPASQARDFYVWSDDPGKYPEARIIFQDFETSNWTWDPVAKAYYWHRFYSHQPDLNFDNPRVRQAVLKVMDFWLKMGVDGLRLDAVPYLFEREGTNCENLPETHEFLKQLRGHVDEHYPGRMLLAEANQWPEEAAAYFGYGDECHMAFHFPIMPRIFMALWMENSHPIVDIMEQTPPIPDVAQWVLFLRNHDELTLEMVTDEERDYMYRTYARDPRARINLGIRRRLFPLMQQNRRKVELLKFILLSLPGTPCLYYGDEIGMGDNYFLGDRNGVRTPMQWSPDRNAGFSKANPQKLYLPVVTDPEYAYEAVNVENQERNPSSLLWWMRRVIGMRKRYPCFSRGEVRFLHPKNPKVLAFLRTLGEETILVVANLSRFAQAVELDLSEFEGAVPVEVFSGNRFPPIGSKPYLMTLGFHDYFWMRLDRGGKTSLQTFGLPKRLPLFQTPRGWKEALSEEGAKKDLESALEPFLIRSRWFSSKTRNIRMVSIEEDFYLEHDGSGTHLLLVEVKYSEGSGQIYFIPVGFSRKTGEDTESTQIQSLYLARASLKGEKGFLFDAAADERFHAAILDFILGRKRKKGKAGEITGQTGKILRSWLGGAPAVRPSRLLSEEQSNTSVVYGESCILKLFRKVEEGTNPEREVSQFLSEKARYSQTPAFLGALEISGPTGRHLLGTLHDFVRNQGTAWRFFLSSLDKFCEEALARKVKTEIPNSEVREAAGEFFFQMIGLLGARTGELHRSLAGDLEDPDFKPEPFTRLYQRAVFQSIRSLIRETLGGLAAALPSLEETTKEKAMRVIQSEKSIFSLLEPLTGKRFGGLKIRIHGDYHLGQVLFTGKDFFIIDFEGEPMRSLTERRLKRSAFRDLAGMLRSFDYAAWKVALERAQKRPEEETALEGWLSAWKEAAAECFLASYFQAVKGEAFVPEGESERLELLRIFTVEKAFYELKYEMNNRPDWVELPLRGILRITRNAGKAGGESA